MKDPEWLEYHRAHVDAIARAYRRDPMEARSHLAIQGYGLWEPEDIWKVIFALRTALYPRRSGGIH